MSWSEGLGYFGVSDVGREEIVIYLYTLEPFLNKQILKPLSNVILVLREAKTEEFEANLGTHIEYFLRENMPPTQKFQRK